MKDLLIKANGWDNKEMDLDFVFTKIVLFMWAFGLMIKGMVMEEWYLKIMTIILDFGNKESIMDLVL